MVPPFWPHWLGWDREPHVTRLVTRSAVGAEGRVMDLLGRVLQDAREERTLEGNVEGRADFHLRTLWGQPLATEGGHFVARPW